ncbi:MAG: hypothetical protein M3Y18_05605 [Candidatus Eremiobacteraeota bacterium]|nr:hypothetical protein [Candidatus Eremiobacteraeota bacterium]
MTQTEPSPDPRPASFRARARFLFTAIRDCQDTIRAVDTKVSILLAALAIPLREVATSVAAWHSHGYLVTLGNVLLTAAILTYVLAAVVAVRTLVGIGDATVHVRGARLENSFYSGGLFRFSPWDALFNHPKAKSTKTVAEFTRDLPQSEGAMVEELSMEAMAVAYIRDIKLHRQRVAFGATVVAGALGLLGLIL